MISIKNNTELLVRKDLFNHLESRQQASTYMTLKTQAEIRKRYQIKKIPFKHVQIYEAKIPKFSKKISTELRERIEVLPLFQSFSHDELRALTPEFLRIHHFLPRKKNYQLIDRVLGSIDLSQVTNDSYRLVLKYSNLNESFTLAEKIKINQWMVIDSPHHQVIMKVVSEI